MAIFNHFSLGIHLFKKVVFAILPGNCLLLFTTILNYLLETFVNGEMTPVKILTKNLVLMSMLIMLSDFVVDVDIEVDIVGCS